MKYKKYIQLQLTWHFPTGTGCFRYGSSEEISTQIQFFFFFFFVPLILDPSSRLMFKQETGHGNMRAHNNAQAVVGFILILIPKTDLTESSH